MRRISLKLVTTVGLLTPGLIYAQGTGVSVAPALDAEYKKNWGLAKINALPAYLKGYTGKGVLVAVVDGGFDVKHPELLGQVDELNAEYFGKNSKNPNDVYPEEASDGHGTHVAGIIGAARDGKGMHGVAYESTILPLFAVGVEGPDPKVAPTNAAIKYAIGAGAKVLNGSYGPPDPPVQIFLLDENGNPIKDKETGKEKPNPNYVQLQYQGLYADPGNLAEQANVLKEAAAADIVMVFAAGNDADDQKEGYSAIPSGPGMLPLITPENTKAGNLYKFINITANGYDSNNPKTYVDWDGEMGEYVASLDFSDLQGSLIAVVAVGNDGKIASFSNRCGAAAEWCLAAPGGDINKDIDHPDYENGIYSSWLRNDADNKNSLYKSINGTSQAAPHVAGAAAVLRSAFPYLNAQQTIETLLTTTTREGYDANPAEFTKTFGQGFLNLGNAINGPGQFRYKGVFDVDTQGYSSVWSNSISGVGDLTKRGQGILVLTGDNSYTGGTNVLGGTLGVEGRIAGKVNVSDSGVLAGTGTVGELTVGDGGTVSPGSTLDPAKIIDTLTIAGNFIQEAGANYLAQLGPNGQSDKVIVDGSASIDRGASIEIQRQKGTTTKLGQRYALLNVQGDIDGSYGVLVSPETPFVDMDLIYEPKTLFLALDRSKTAFSAVGYSHNQRAAGAAAERLNEGNAVYDNVLFLNASEARNAFDQLSGEVHASIRAGLIEDSHFVRDTANDRLRAAFRSTGSASVSGLRYSAGAQSAAPTPPGEITLWGKGFGAWAQFKADGNAERFKKNTGGFFIGGDRLVGQNWRLGVLTGYSHTSFHVNGRASSGSSDNYHLGLYAGTQHNAWNFRSGLGYTWHRIKTDRSVAFSDFSDKLSARYNAGTFQAFGELGYRIDTTFAALEPYANLSYVHFKAKHFSEDGGAAALSGKSQSNSTTFTTIGLRATSTFELGTTEADVHGGIGWRHAFNRINPKTDLSFGNQSSFSVKGTPIAKNAAVLEAGLNVKLGKTSTVGIAYQGQFGSGVREHGLEANVAVRF